MEVFLQEGEAPSTPSTSADSSQGNNSDASSSIIPPDSSDNCWNIPNHGVFAPPKLDGVFRFGLMEDNVAYHSTLLQVSKEDRWYSLKFEGRLPRKGSTNICIQSRTRSYCITIVTNFEENIQVLQLLPTFSVGNNTGDSLILRAMCLRKPSGNKAKPGSVHPERSLPISLPCLKSHENLLEHPLLFWTKLDCEKSLKPADNSSNACDQLRCVQFGLESFHSEPLMVEEIGTDIPFDKRVSFSLPYSGPVTGCGLPSSNRPYILTVHQLHGRTKLLVQQDDEPQMLIYNNTMAPLIIG